MIVTHLEKIDAIVVDAFICDRCKRTFCAEEGSLDVFEIQEFVHLEDTGGYGSIWGDGTHWKLDLCQHCAEALFGAFVQYE